MFLLNTFKYIYFKTIIANFYADVNECLSNPCSVNADCQNINGSFTCTCKDGFDGTGFVCNGSLKKFITLYLTICCTHRCMLFYVLF